MATIPRRRVRRLVSDQASRPGAQFLDAEEIGLRESSPPSCGFASRWIRSGSTAAACSWSTRHSLRAGGAGRILAALLGRLGEREPGRWPEARIVDE